MEKLTEKEYEQFVSKHETHHFMKSFYFGEVMKEKNYIPHYLGLKKNKKVVAAVLLLEKKINKYSYFYSPRGYSINYSDKKLLNEMTKGLKKYVKQYKGIFIKIDPNIKRHDLDVNGNITKESTEDVFGELKNLGYKHKGFSKDFVDEQPRFTFNINLDKSFDDVYKSMHATTRNILNRNNPYGLDIYVGDIKDIPYFYQTMLDTSRRENIIPGKEEYYAKFYEILNKHGMSDVYVVKCNIKKLKTIYKKLIKEVTGKLDEINNNPNSTKKAKNKLNDLNDELKKLNKENDLVKQIKKEEIILSSMLTTKYIDTAWTVHGGNADELRFLNANYYLYYQIIKDAYENGMKNVDLFGTSGHANPDKTDPIYGIHLFKKRFGGEYVEYIGEFDLVCKPFMYWLYTVVVPFRRKLVKRKLRKKMNNGN